MAARSVCVCLTCGQQCARSFDLVRKLLFARLPLFAKVFGIGFKVQVAFEDRHARGRVADALDIHAQRKTVEELRAQVAFFRVHRADEDKARRMRKADALALDDVDAHRRAIEQQVHHVIVQQVDFVHVQQAAIGRRQHARLKVALALLNRALNIQRAHDAVLGRAHRQVHELGAAQRERQRLAARRSLAAIGAPRRPGYRGRSRKRAIGHDGDLRQQRGQRAGGGGLGRAALAADQHAADLRIDRIEDQRAMHPVCPTMAVNGKTVGIE